MPVSQAFQPSGQCYALAGAVSPPAGVQITPPAVGPQLQFRVVNSGAVVATVAYAATAAAATTSAALATAGTPAGGTVLAAGETMMLIAPPGQFWSSATASSTATVYVQPGSIPQF